MPYLATIQVLIHGAPIYSSRDRASDPKAVTLQGGCEGVEQSGMLSAWRHTQDTTGERGGVPQYAMGMVPSEVVQCSRLGRPLTQPGRGDVGAGMVLQRR